MCRYNRLHYEIFYPLKVSCLGKGCISFDLILISNDRLQITNLIFINMFRKSKKCKLKNIFFRSNLTILVCSITLIYGCANQSIVSDSNSKNTGVVNTSDQTTNNVRLITHALGETPVPANPKNVVVLDTDRLDSSLALGIKPVGAVANPAEGFASYLGDQTEGITIVGSRKQPNIETILRLKPDLIMGNAREHRKIYDRLKQIAPTVLTEGRGTEGNWQELFQKDAQVLGKTETAEKLLSKYNQRVSKLKEKLSEKYQGKTISIISIAQDRLGVLTDASFPGSILTNVGLEIPEFQKSNNQVFKQVSREKLESIDSDIIFLLYFKTTGTSLPLEEFKNDKLFSQLKAVKEKQIYQVDGRVWITGSSIQAANGVLDDLSRNLLSSEKN